MRQSHATICKHRSIANVKKPEWTLAFNHATVECVTVCLDLSAESISERDRWRQATVTVQFCERLYRRVRRIYATAATSWWQWAPGYHQPDTRSLSTELMLALTPFIISRDLLQRTGNNQRLVLCFSDKFMPIVCLYWRSTRPRTVHAGVLAWNCKFKRILNSKQLCVLICVDTKLQKRTSSASLHTIPANY
jgi:hypothetical protein